MKSKYIRIICALTAALLSTAIPVFCQAADVSYHLEKEIPVSGLAGCNSLVLDEIAHRIYIVNDTTIEVVDLAKETVIGGFTNATGISGFTLAPKWRRGFWCTGHDSKMYIMDLRSFKTIQTLDVPKVPSGIIYDPNRALLYTLNNADHSTSIFEADDGDYLTTLELPGAVNTAVADPKSGMVYCSIKDQNELDVIHPSTHKIINRWQDLPKGEVTAIAVDGTRHQLFLGTADKMVVLIDATNGKVLTATSLSAPVDDIVFDPSTRVILTSAGGAFASATEYTLTEIRTLQTLETKLGPAAMVSDPSSRKVYMAPLAPHQQSSSSGNFKLTIYGMDKSASH